MNLVEYLQEPDPAVRDFYATVRLSAKVVVLPEQTAGCDVMCFLVDSKNEPCGVLTIAGCRFGASVRNPKDVDQRLKVQVRKQYGKVSDNTWQQTAKGKEIVQLLDSPDCKLKYFAELLVRC